jgi:protein-disulfide isomerase
MKLFPIALASAALLLAACDQKPALAAYTVVPISPFMDTPVLGDPNAPVELTEYASTTCGHCKAFHDEVFPQLKAKYIDTGKVKLVWAVMPTQPTAISLAGAAIARCAGEKQFFPAIDSLFDAQDTLFEAASDPRKLRRELVAIGGKFGLTPDQVGTCIDSKDVLALTRDTVKNAPASVTGTPSFVIKGEKLDIETFEGLAAAIDAELAKAAQPAAPT